jgi:hypothetical protein
VSRLDRFAASLAGDGEMSERIYAFDWSKLASARLTMVRFLLANRFPLLLWWGPEYLSIYMMHIVRYSAPSIPGL